MKPAPIPKNEIARLHDLLSYEVLDTPPENIYDDYVQVAAEVCQTPIALISLVDSERQWFKAKVGLEISETHRNVSMCAHAIMQPDLFLVNHPEEDERFKDFPAVKDGVRFYAGMPLVNSQGHALGTLCVVDMKPRELNPSQKRVLALLSNQVVTQLELRKALIEKARSMQETKDLTLALLSKTEELKSTEKFRFLDEMAGKMSHELKNPLAGIMLLVASVKRKLPDEALKEQLTKAETLVKRMSSIITCLEVFSGMREFEKEKTSTEVTIQELRDLTEERLRELGIDLSIQGESYQVLMSPPQVLRVLHSLVENSIDAIRDLPERWIRITISKAPQSHLVQIRVIDSGKGIPQDILPKIMMPFFSTKDVGKGVGLGLSLASTILKDHKGELRYELHQGHTSFVLELPVCEASLL